MLILPLLLVAWAMQGAEQLPALSEPVATMTIESAKYCLGATGLGWIDKRHPVPADAVMLMLKVLVKYRNQGSVPILLVPRYRTDQFIGLSPDHLEGPRGRSHTESLDIAPARIDGLPTLQVPIVEVIRPGEASRFANPEQVVQIVYSPRKRKIDLRGQKLWFQLEMHHYQIAPRLGRELTQEKPTTPWWTGTVRTNILDVDIPASPSAEKCAVHYRID